MKAEYLGKSIAFWAKELDLHYNTLCKRMKGCGSLELAVKHYQENGVRRAQEHAGKTAVEWAKELDISIVSLCERRHKLGSLELAVKYYQERGWNNSNIIGKRSQVGPVRAVGQSVDGYTLLAATCPVCGRGLVLTGKEAVKFEHSEEFCSSLEWE